MQWSSLVCYVALISSPVGSDNQHLVISFSSLSEHSVMTSVTTLAERRGFKADVGFLTTHYRHLGKGGS